MTWLDQKGKLFGIINIFDLLVLLFLLAGGVVFYQFLTQSPAQMGEIQEIVVLVEDIRPEIASAIQNGDLLYNPKYSKNAPVAVVKAILAKTAARKVSSDMQGNLLARFDPLNQDVRFTLHFLEPIEVWPTKMLLRNRPLSHRVGADFSGVNHKYALTMRMVSQGDALRKK